MFTTVLHNRPGITFFIKCFDSETDFIKRQPKILEILSKLGENRKHLAHFAVSDNNQHPGKHGFKKMYQEPTLYFKQTRKDIQILHLEEKQRGGRWKEGKVSFHQAMRDRAFLWQVTGAIVKPSHVNRWRQRISAFTGSGLKT